MTLRQKINTHAGLLSFFVTLVVGMFVGMSFLYLQFWPVHPLVVYRVAVPSPQHAGTTMDYSVTYCRNVSGPAMVDRTLVGVGKTSYNFPYLPVGSITTQGCKTTHVLLPIDKVVPSGTYKIRIAATFRINPIRNITVLNESNTFEVVGQ